MSNIQYGLISETDARTLEETIDLLCEEFEIGKYAFNVLELGCYSGMTGKFLKETIENKGRQCYITGVDNNKDGEKIQFEYDCMFIGNSSDFYWRIKDEFYHLVFVDADHSYLGVISDFYAYASKVKVGGYLAFHDTGEHIKPFKDFQHGDKGNPDAYISVRKALNKIGLFHYETDPYEKYAYRIWDLVFDEANEADEAGGICVFQKLY